MTLFILGEGGGESTLVQLVEHWAWKHGYLGSIRGKASFFISRRCMKMLSPSYHGNTKVVQS